MSDNHTISQAIVISDLHCGCQYGLCPPTPITLDGGGTYSSSELQRKVWFWWEEFWNEWVPEATRGENYVVVINGDTIEGIHHNATTQISHNLNDQKHVAMEVLQPILSLSKAKKLFMIRGTQAHVGQAGEDEEKLAEILGAESDEIGNRARNELWLRIGEEQGTLCHFLHHISTAGSTAYEPTALAREFAVASEEAGRWRLEAPDIIIRSHRHRYNKTEFPTAHGYGICLTTPGWQLKTPLVWRIQGGRNSLPQFGGVIVRRGDEEHYTRAFVKNITRTPEVRI
jgi:hypothetical protein